MQAPDLTLLIRRTRYGHHQSHVVPVGRLAH